MSSDERIRNRRNFRSPLLLIGLAMTVVYLFLGAYILIDKSFLPAIPVEFRNIFAGMLVVYAIFRGWRIYQDYF